MERNGEKYEKLRINSDEMVRVGLNWKEMGGDEMK